MQEEVVQSVGKRQYLQISGHPVGELLGIFRNLVVQVDGGGVLQACALLLYRCDYLWVAVSDAHRHNASKGLQSHGGCSDNDELGICAASVLYAQNSLAG
jgi:hypothetical protein